jgi:hypothetical protein
MAQDFRYSKTENEKAMDRLTIYPKDIQRITGRSDRYGRLLLRKIKLHFKKQEHQFVTIEEFCSYTGLKEDIVNQRLGR